MTSPPDVQNVPDIWALLERMQTLLSNLPDVNFDYTPLDVEVDTALAQRDRFVLVPKEPVAVFIYSPTTLEYGVRWLNDPPMINGDLLYSARAPKPEGKP